MLNDPLITAAHVRAARAWLLNWKQDELSEKSGVSQGAIARYEQGRSVPRAETLANFRTAFEQAGVRSEFAGMSGMGIRIERAVTTRE
ncbi:helix-turn-helix transcriptional regulator [Tardiphaga sp. OK245]|uniref:helix-turn-helix domain-containing protein n=1 Tax=Tardiphaga sp. OK245 TaxID=1855306 RepID=UPI0008A7596B|nr:helix-turn-helix transcriptional regulator [Tardiphaga sp. OK245]SEH87801.1 Helix-turn-helix [Tardiphaga sp. OK245]